MVQPASRGLPVDKIPILARTGILFDCKSSMTWKTLEKQWMMQSPEPKFGRVKKSAEGSTPEPLTCFLKLAVSLKDRKLNKIGYFELGGLSVAEGHLIQNIPG
jgi:hypothetical protein